MIEKLTSVQAMRVMVAVLAVIASIAALQAAQPVLQPMVFALVLGIVVSPIDDRLTKLGLSDVLSATILLLMTCGAVAVVVYVLQLLVASLIDRLPQLQSALRDWILSLEDLLRGIENFRDEIEKTVGQDALEPAAPRLDLGNALWIAPNFIASLFIFVGTFFFFTLTRHRLYAACGPARTLLLRADRLVSRYFLAVTIVNLGVGAATAAAMALLGLEYALLWGVAAGLLNYMLYLGPMIIIAGLLIAGLVQFWGAAALLPPACFILINIAEAQFVTPWFVGQKVNLNPLVVFLAIVFGLWIWGPIGAIVALPIVLWANFMLTARSDPPLPQKAGM